MQHSPDNGAQLSDAELARRAAVGEAAAFDALVLRHREGVLKAARAIVGSQDQAEDVAQQAFIEAFRGLHGLRDLERFKAWMMTITRRCAYQQLARGASEPRTVEFCETIMGPLHAPTPDPKVESLGERIRSMLEEMAWRSRTVVTLHYLDGYSTSEIGTRLGIPAGTVRRILYESRNSLRAGMGVVAATRSKGEPRTMATATTKQKGPREMDWWINGSWPGPIMASMLAQSICLTINKNAKTAAEIADEIEANVRYIEEGLLPLVGERLITKTENGRYLANFVALDAGDWIELTHGIRENADKLADAVLPHLPRLREAWEKTSLPEQGFPWSEGIWPMLAVFVLNLAIPPHSSPSAEPPSRASGKRYWAGGREVVPDEYVMWLTGWDNTGTRDKRLNYGHLWSYGLARERPSLDAHTQLLFDAIATGASSISAVVEHSRLNEELVREVSARAIEMGLVRRTGEALALTFPVFRVEESDVLAPVVKEISDRLTSDILLDATADMADRLRALGYGHLEEQFGQWRRWLEGNVAGEALRELMKRGVLPEPNNPAPMSFCMIGWMGTLLRLEW